SCAAQLCLRYEHVCSHAWNVDALGIVETNLENDSLDVALTAAYVALGCEIGFSGFEKHLARYDGPTGKPDSQRVANANVVCIGFRNCSSHPCVCEINDGNDRLAGIQKFSFPRGAHRNSPRDRCIDLGVAQTDFRFFELGFGV